MGKEKFASLSWCAGDVESILEDLSIEWSPARIQTFLRRNERHLQDRLAEKGNEILRDLVEFDVAENLGKK